MPDAISNTSPLLYLYRIGGIDWLPELFDEIWTPTTVINELYEGRQRGHDVPDPDIYTWLHVVDPQSTPSEWLSLGLGAGELAAMALALERTIRLDLRDGRAYLLKGYIELSTGNANACADLKKAKELGMTDADALLTGNCK